MKFQIITKGSFTKVKLTDFGLTIESDLYGEASTEHAMAVDSGDTALRARTEPACMYALAIELERTAAELRALANPMD